MSKTISGELVEQEINGREGTLYVTKNYVYKVFGSIERAERLCREYQTAETKGVPVSDTAKFMGQLQ
jgi:hypothetical protein